MHACIHCAHVCESEVIEDMPPDDVHDLAKPAVVVELKTTRNWLRRIVCSSPHFIYISEDNLEEVVDAFQGPHHVKAGTTVIAQGSTVSGTEPGLFVIESGSLDVFVVKGVQKPPGSHVFTFDTAGQTFGHIALLYDCPRSASIVARTDAVVWHICRDRFKAGMDGYKIQQIVERYTMRMAEVGLTVRSISLELPVFCIDILSEASQRINLQRYYELCRHSKELMCTTSCFSKWHKNKKTNGHAKVIPVVRSSKADGVRVFFFDDNAEMHGKQDSSGIVNLRDIETGEFVEFCDGANGFQGEQVATNTVVQYSSEYSVVLARANILDAMEDEDYFLKIIQRYSAPGEKLVVFMDVNSTIMGVDSIANKNMSEALLSTMLAFIEVEPMAAFDYTWDGRPPVKIIGKTDFKQLVKKLCAGDNGFYNKFYTLSNCTKLLQELDYLATVKWVCREESFTLSNFKTVYEGYLETLVGATDEEGICNSWFKLYASLIEGQHSVVLNSFGVDTRKVICRTVEDEKTVLQVAVNTEYWTEKDVKAYEKMIGVSIPEVQPP